MNLNPARALRTARSRLEYRPPAGTTHVLAHVPAGEDPGLWELRTLRNWLAGDSAREYCPVPGPESMTEEDFAAVALGGPGGTVLLGEAGFLGGFDVPARRDPSAVPAYWIEVVRYSPATPRPVAARRPVSELTRDEQRAACAYPCIRGDAVVYVDGVTGNDITPDTLVPVPGEVTK